jgi:UrcA family protein
MIKTMIIAATLSTTFAMAASASVVNTQTVSVPYQASVVGSDEAQTVLIARIKRAAKQVCGTTHRTNAGSLTQVMRNRTCYKSTLESAIDEAQLKQSNNS